MSYTLRPETKTMFRHAVAQMDEYLNEYWDIYRSQKGSPNGDSALAAHDRMKQNKSEYLDKYDHIYDSLPES